MAHHGPDAVAQDVAAQKLNIVIQEDPVPRRCPLQRPPQPLHVRVDRPVRADDDARRIPDALAELLKQPRQIRGPMGEDTKRNLVSCQTLQAPVNDLTADALPPPHPQ